MTYIILIMYVFSVLSFLIYIDNDEEYKNLRKYAWGLPFLRIGYFVSLLLNKEYNINLLRALWDNNIGIIIILHIADLNEKIKWYLKDK